MTTSQYTTTHIVSFKTQRTVNGLEVSHTVTTLTYEVNDPQTPALDDLGVSHMVTQNLHDEENDPQTPAVDGLGVSHTVTKLIYEQNEPYIPATLEKVTL